MDDESVGIANRYLPLSDYGLIGDSRSAALVSRFGSIDWCCWPNFDGPSLFARLVDYDKGGYFAISPTEPFRTRRRYVGPTAVLETTFETPDGTARLTDLMPAFSEAEKRRRPRPFRYILRRVEGIQGTVSMRLSYVLRPEFATVAPDLYSRGPQRSFRSGGTAALPLAIGSAAGARRQRASQRFPRPGR